MMRNPEQTIGNIIDKQKICHLSSVDREGFPNTKAMLSPRKREGIKHIYLSTNTSSMRVAQYRENPKACLYFEDRRFFRGVMLIGTVEVMEDSEHKEMLWQSGDTMYYPLGVTDPDYCVLKFTAYKGRYYSNFKSEDFAIRPARDFSAIEAVSAATRDLATAYIRDEWQTERIAVRGEIIDCSTIEGFILLDEKRENVLGLITYIFRDNACEIVSLNSKYSCTGLGTALIEKVKAKAIACGCKTLRLLTSNDSLNAIGFYQKRGFELAGVNLGAIDRERATNKPEIPLIGQNGIPLHHEIDFSMSLE